MILMMTTQNTNRIDREDVRVDMARIALSYVRRSSAEGRPFWQYHECYQPALDTLAASRAVINWGGLSLAHVYQPWYLESSGYWTREAFIDRVTSVIYWMERDANMSHRADIVAHMADWVCALADLAAEQGE